MKPTRIPTGLCFLIRDDLGVTAISGPSHMIGKVLRNEPAENMIVLEGGRIMARIYDPIPYRGQQIATAAVYAVRRRI